MCIASTKKNAARHALVQQRSMIVGLWGDSEKTRSPVGDRVETANTERVLSYYWGSSSNMKGRNQGGGDNWGFYTSTPSTRDDATTVRVFDVLPRLAVVIEVPWFPC